MEPTSDPYTVVRATAQAAYASGKAHLDRGELEAALVDLDRAKTNDPDNRPDIQQALDETIARLQAQTPTAAPSSAPPRSVVVSTVPAAIASVSIAAPTQASGLPAVPGKPGTTATTPTNATSPTTATTATTQTTQTSASPAVVATPIPLATWNDPQGRFSVGAPLDWSRVDPPQALFGTPVVEFHDPSGRASFGVAVDTSAKAVSPELYAASMELTMQQQVAGYALESLVPGSTAGNPSVRRVFTFTERDSAGSDIAVRGLQLVVLKGSTPYVIAATAPTTDYPRLSAVFEQMVDSFRFG